MIAQQEDAFFRGGAASPLDFDLSDQMDVPARIVMEGYVVLFPARLEASGAVRLALIEINNHAPLARGCRTFLGWRG
jgi:hypothetical protein